VTFVIPTAVNLMTTAHGSDARARGGFSEGTPTAGSKVNGNLPITSNAASMTVSNGDGFEGLYWEFLASGGYDVSTDTKIMIGTWQFNAPNRIECDTAANDGIVVRIGTGSGSPPTNYRTFQIGGNDKVAGQARENPKMWVIDLNDDSHEAVAGTFDNTDVQCWGYGLTGLDLGGSTSLSFFQRAFVLDTTKNASDIPRFTGASDWGDCITAMGTTHSTKITDEWLKREGAVFSIACPVEFGDNSTSTQFDDAGASVFWPDHDDAADPRVRVTEQAFRVYLNLRNNAADTADFAGFYDCGNSYPPWDFDQDDAAVVTFDSPTFKRTGQFDVGSSITGPATWDDCGIVWCMDNGVDLDGSTFRNPHGDHLLRLEA